jgi:hypothetical protein
VITAARQRLWHEPHLLARPFCTIFLRFSYDTPLDMWHTVSGVRGVVPDQNPSTDIT